MHLPSNLTVSAENNTAVNATGTLPSNLLAAANKTKMTAVRDAQSSSLHSKDGESAKSAALPSSLHGPTANIKVNATWASPSGLQGRSEVSKSRSGKEQHISYTKYSVLIH